MKKPKQILIKSKLLDELWEAYIDSLDLEKKKDLTEWGRGELFVMRRLFKKCPRKI